MDISTIDTIIDSRMMDTCIFRSASLFIGNPASSISFPMAMWREIDGHAPTANL
jgi:hypothetical protein